MSGLIYLLIASLLLGFSPYFFLERKQKHPIIKKARGVPDSYILFDRLLIALLFVGTVFSVSINNEHLALFFPLWISIDMLKTGLFAGLTGKFIIRRSFDYEYFYTDHDHLFSVRRLSVSSVGWWVSIISIILLIPSFVYTIQR